MIWFGRLSAISQLASRVGGRGGVGQSLSISLYYLAQGERQGGSPLIELGKNEISSNLRKYLKHYLPTFFARAKQQQFNANAKNIPEFFMHSWTQIFAFANLYQAFLPTSQ
jgi:hypothetical protein